MSSRRKHLYEFGPYRLDVVERILLREGKDLQLTPKGFELLLTLVRNNGRIMEKRELMDLVWPDCFVEEANLTQHVSVLRKLLGESFGKPQFIETVPKRGYRFIADVREYEESEIGLILEHQTESSLLIETQTTGEIASGIGERWKGLQPGGIGAAIALPWPRAVSTPLALMAGLTVIGLIIWLFPGRKTRPGPDLTREPRVIQLYSLKSEQGRTLSGGRFSPDGKMIAFDAPGDGQNIWIMQVNGERRLQITEEKCRDWSPIWSPDSQQIAFISDRGNQLGIWAIPFLGGRPRPLATLEASPTVVRSSPPTLKAWSKNRNVIYYEWKRNLFSLDLNSQEVAPVTNFDPKIQFPQDFSVSPDENWIAYTTHQDGQYDIWRIAFSGGTPIRVTNDAAPDQSPLWRPDGQGLIYNSPRDGNLQIYAADLGSSGLSPVTTGDRNLRLSDISADGLRILCYVQRDESDLYSVDENDGQEKQLTGELGLEFWPTVSPDSANILFQSVQGERFLWEPKKSLLLLRPVAANAQPARLAANAFAAQWSPDGEKIAFLRNSGGFDQLYIAQATGGEEKQLTVNGVTFGGHTFGPAFNLFQIMDYSWSSDSSRIAFSSKQNGIASVKVVAVDGSDQTALSAGADPKLLFECPIWSPGGRQLAYVAEKTDYPVQGRREWSLWIAGRGAPEQLFQSESVIRLLGWLSDNEALVALVENAGLNRALPAQIRVIGVSISGRRQRSVHEFNDAYLTSLRLSPDARNLSLVMAQEGRDNIWLFPLADGRTRMLTDNRDRKEYLSSPVWSPDGKALYFARQTKWSMMMMIENIQ